MHKDQQQKDKGDITMVKTERTTCAWARLRSERHGLSEEEKFMLYKHVTTVGLVVALLCLASPPVFAQQSANDGPMSTGVVATIIAIDARTSAATLQTNAGDVFELPQRSQWHVGHQVLCDQTVDRRRPRLQHCQLWEEGHSGVQSPAPRAGRFAETELPRTTPRGLFWPND
jgi:hypothetical protein